MRIDGVPEDQAFERTADHWDDVTARYSGEGSNTNRSEWQGHPAYRERRARSLHGRLDHEWLIAKFPNPIERALGAGCGIAEFELKVLASGAVDHFDLFDVSAGSLEIARRSAEHLGLSDRITIHHGDMFSASGNYGLVTFVGSLHHSLDVCQAVRFAHDILEPGGFLYGDEYIGPRRFAYPLEHSELAKSLYRSLAPELRSPWPELPQPDPADVAAADPTEAVESDLIMSELHRQFPQVDSVPQHGALAFMLWWGLDHDALWESQLGREFASLLFDLDESLALSGRLPDYFSLISARRD
jgi:SAM-dependent methyltransferase